MSGIFKDNLENNQAVLDYFKGLTYSGDLFEGNICFFKELLEHMKNKSLDELLNSAAKVNHKHVQLKITFDDVAIKESIEAIADSLGTNGMS